MLERFSIRWNHLNDQKVRRNKELERETERSESAARESDRAGDRSHLIGNRSSGLAVPCPSTREPGPQAIAPRRRARSHLGTQKIHTEAPIELPRSDIWDIVSQRLAQDMAQAEFRIFDEGRSLLDVSSRRNAAEGGKPGMEPPSFWSCVPVPHWIWKVSGVRPSFRRKSPTGKWRSRAFPFR